MATEDTGCSIVPYFKVNEGKLEEFKSICEEFVSASANESDCLYYGFCFDGDTAHCREAYKDADGVLAHLDNVGEILNRALTISELLSLEIHGPAQELAKLKEPLAELSPQYFTLEYGFRN